MRHVFYPPYACDDFSRFVTDFACSNRSNHALTGGPQFSGAPRRTRAGRPCQPPRAGPVCPAAGSTIPIHNIQEHGLDSRAPNSYSSGAGDCKSHRRSPRGDGGVGHVGVILGASIIPRITDPWYKWCAPTVRLSFSDFPAIHTIRKLRGFTEDLDHRLIEVWPRYHRGDRSHFEILRRAYYAEARYSEQYERTGAAGRARCCALGGGR